MENNKIGKIESISVEKFKELAKQEEYTIIDIRTAMELLPENGGKVFEQAINLDFYDREFLKKIGKLDKNKKYLIYCRSGYRTSEVLKIMRSLGFEEVLELDGGVLALARLHG